MYQIDGFRFFVEQLRFDLIADRTRQGGTGEEQVVYKALLCEDSIPPQSMTFCAGDHTVSYAELLYRSLLWDFQSKMEQWRAS